MIAGRNRCGGRDRRPTAQRIFRINLQIEHIFMNPTAPAIMPLLLKLRCCCEDNQRDVCASVGLSSSEFAGLTALEESERVAGAELAARIRLSPSRCSRVIDRMVEHGYLYRETCADDRRAIRSSLTPKGAKLKRRLADEMRSCEDRIIARLTPDQIRSAVQTLNLLIDAVHH